MNPLNTDHEKRYPTPFLPQLGADFVQVQGSSASFLHGAGLVDISNSLTINGGSDYSLQGSGTLNVPVINIGGSGSGSLLILGSAQLSQVNTLNVNSGGLLDIRKDYSFPGTLSLSSTTVQVKDGATAKTLYMIQSGLLRGNGTVDGNLINDAYVDPGLGYVGSFTLTGDYEQTANNGHYSVDIAGTSSSSYDHLDVTGDVTLDGDLEVQYVSGFTPSEGNEFNIISYEGSLTGTFNSVTLPSPSSGVSVGIIYGANKVTVAAGIEGDLNYDRYVGLDDLDIILNNWNTTVPEYDWSQGDPNGDGYVGLDDLDIVLDNWNNGTPPSFLVPEPVSSVWFCCGFLGLTAGTRLTRVVNF